jgi:alkylation response protein AidB-like acyl-CoA dehydrogenase
MSEQLLGPAADVRHAGAEGSAWEHEAHRYLKRAKTTQLVLGTRGGLRRLIADLAGPH